MMKGENAKAIICAILGNVIWGFGFLFTSVALSIASVPSVMLAHRFLLSTICMLFFMLIGKGRVSLKGKNWKPIIFLLGMQLCYYLFETYSVLYTNSTMSGLVLAVVPVVTIGTGALFLKEYPTRRQALFCVMPVAGVIIMTVSGKDLGVATPLGILFLLLTMLASALYKTANRKASAEFTPFERTFFVLSVSAAVFVLAGLGAVDWDMAAFVAPLMHWKYLASVLSLGILSSIAANMLVNYATGQMSAFKISAFGSLSTLCAGFAGIVILKEPVSVSFVLGAVLIIFGVRQVTKPKDMPNDSETKKLFLANIGGANMKKWKYVIAALVAVVLVGAVAVVFLLPKNKNDVPPAREYGVGAPINGTYNVENSPYYVVTNDYFSMPSTQERLIFPQFKTYQQTMQDTSGLACLLMVLDYMGQDVENQYSELALLEMYEQLNGVEVYNNGTTEEGLIKLIDSLNLGYTATNEDPAASEGFTSAEMKTFFLDAISQGKFVLVRYQSPVGYGWKVVIGYDDLGEVTDTTTGKQTTTDGDDVIIFAEPYDGADHCQDGYATERALDFCVWWKHMDVTGDVTDAYSFVVIDPNLDITFDLQPVDETVKQTLYDIHLPLNPDGTYGSSRDEMRYGPIISGRGWWNHTESSYYKINDFYNMGSEGSRIMLKNYTVLQQTMRSSCGNCAVNSVLSYYGMEGDPYELEETYVKLYEKVNKKNVRGNGTSPKGHVAALAEWGYVATNYGGTTTTGIPFPTYDSYMEFIRTNLKAGKPIVVSTYLGSGHFLTVIGMDDMGTDYIYDDVVITADSCDYWDGYQDGYNVFSAYKFYTQHTTKTHTSRQLALIIEKPEL